LRTITVSSLIGAGAEHRGDLRDSGGAHRRLVEEDAPEMVAVGEDLVLARQEGATGVHQVDARQAVLRGDLLGAQVLLHRHRVVGAAFDRRIVGDDHAFPPRHTADSRDDPGGRALVVVHTVGGQWSDLQQRAARIEETVHPFARQQLAASDVTFTGLLRTTGRCGRQLVA
jgi:hypothetical protein